MTNLSLKVKNQLLDKIKEKYRRVRKKDKSTIISHILDLTGYDRKYAIYKLNKERRPSDKKKRVVTNLKYNAALKDQLVKIWCASNKICSKRLVPFIPEIMPVLEKRNHINLTEIQRSLLTQISSSTVDRLLQTVRTQTKRKGRSGTGASLLKHSIKIKTFSCDNDIAEPGYFEADLVSHCGGDSSGQFLHTLVMTDIYSQWTEFFPLAAKTSEEVILALIEAKACIPFTILGFDTDNGCEFINSALLSFCKSHSIKFTRSRPYKKNDQAHVEEKNGSIIRKVVGYDRFEGLSAEKSLAELYAILRLYINYFQPSLKLKGKKRDGAKVIKSYDDAKTPYRRIMNSQIGHSIKEKLTSEYNSLDPVALLSKVQKSQETFWKYAQEKQQQAKREYSDLMSGINNDINEFKSSVSYGSGSNSDNKKEKSFSNIPELQLYPSSAKPTKRVSWVTHEDSFKDVWNEIEIELQNNASITGIDLMNDLIKKYPDKFQMGQVRTLQRRISKWKSVQRDARMKQKEARVQQKERRIFTSLIPSFLKW